MTTVPPPSTSAPPAVAPAQAAPTATVPSPPVALLQLAAGAPIEGVVVKTPDQPPPPPLPQQPAQPPPQVQQPAPQPQQPQPQQTPQAPTPSPSPESPPPEPRPSVTLRTPAGNLTLRTPLPLPEGSKVTVELVRASPAQATVRFVAVDGVPIAKALPQLRPLPAAQQGAPPQQLPPLQNQNPLLRAPVLPPGSAWTPGGPAPLPNLNFFSAYVLSAPVPPGSPVPGAPVPFALTAGGELTLRVTAFELPPPGSQPGANPVLGAAPQQPGVVQPGGFVPPAVGQAITSPAMQPQQAVGLDVANAAKTPANPAVSGTPATPNPAVLQGSPQPGLALPGPQGWPQPSPNPPQTVQQPPVQLALTGTVAANTANGAVVVQTDAGQIQLNVRANLPPGATVSLEITTQIPPRDGGPPPLLPLPGSVLPLATTAAGWPTLSESMQLLQRFDPQAAAQLSAAIPDGGARTAVAAMSFVQALRTGDARQWPGDSTLRALERAGPRGAHLASVMSAEVAELSARARDTGGDWRMLPIPWNAEGQIERVALITRREDAGDDDGGKKKGGKGKGTRFLVNLDLSRLGELQLDGMFRKESRAFDMVIRTKEPLPDDMRRDLTGLFANSNAAMGLQGGLAFQVVKKFPDPVAQGQPLAQDKSGLWA